VERKGVPQPPFVVAPAEDIRQGPQPPWRTSAAIPLQRDRGPFRVLLAEDDAEMRSVVADALRGDGYQVIEAADGGRLLVDVAARLKGGDGANSLDLIVSDIRMPICTGLQILAALREAHWRTPVILMTAFGDEGVRRHAESLDAVLFDKPFDVDDLRTAVSNLLPRGRPRR
jgi:CheY-like chemotaxis protein